MPVISSSIPNLINGISQQNPTQRNLTQGEAQINAQSSLVKGLQRRPPLEFVKNLLNSQIYSTNTAIHPFIRDGDNQYIVAAYNGGINVYDLLGNSKSVTISSGSSYLTSTDPKGDFKFASVGDTTFILNKSIKPAMAATTNTAKQQEALVYLVGSNFGRTYKINLYHPSMGSTTTSFEMPDGSNVSTQGYLRDTATIANILITGSSAQGSFTGTALNAAPISTYFDVTRYNSVIHIKPKDNSAAFTISSSDGAGESTMYTIKDSVNDFQKLPYIAPANFLIKVTGDEGTSNNDYYVKFTSNGIWKETLGPGVKTTIDKATMPHKLVRDAATDTFSFSQIDWDLKTTGDDDSNPNPTFIGYTINNITFYKNRLAILADENIIMSEAGSFYNFFATTVASVLATDPIDLAATTNEVSILRHALPFNEELLLFSDKAQFKIETANAGLSPSDASITLSTRFESNSEIAPIGAGNYIYFVQKRGLNSAVREYFVQPDTTNNDSIDITASIPSYIPVNVHKLISNTIEDTIVALADDGSDTFSAPHTVVTSVNPNYAKRIYVYKYFWNGNDKVQSAWSYWEFPDVQIIGGFAYESYIYLIANERTKANLYKIDLRNLENTNLGMNIYLDQRVLLTGTYNSGTNRTTFTLPYLVKAGLQAVSATTGADLSIISQSTNTVIVDGNNTSAYFGFAFTTLYTLSTQFIREPSKGGGLLAVTSGRYQVRTMSFDYTNSGFFQIVVTHTGRADQTYSFNGYIIDNPTSVIDSPVVTTGTFRVPIQAENTKHAVSIRSSSYLPANITSAEIEGFYYRRSARV